MADARGGPRRFRDGSPSTPILFSGRSPSNNGLDKKLSKRDGGVGVVLEDESLHGAFKVPSLRNIELTAPYMHDGRLKTLDSVFRHYNQRVQPHPTLDRRLQGRRGAGAVRLNLNSRERRALVAFMKTLTDNEFQKDPRFGDPFR